MRPSRNKTSLKKKPKKTPKGDDLFDQVIKLTGIPQQSIRRELKSILERKNIDVNQLTLEQLRGVVASYLREIMGNLLDRAGHRRPENQN